MIPVTTPNLDALFFPKAKNRRKAGPELHPRKKAQAAEFVFQKRFSVNVTKAQVSKKIDLYTCSFNFSFSTKIP